MDLTKARSGRASAGAVTLLAFASLLVTAPLSHAQDDAAKRMLKAMSDYVTSQNTISATIDTALEVVTPDLQKIQFASSGRVILSRLDKIRASRVGGYTDVELIFDGKMFTLHDKHNATFAQANSPGSLEQFVERLRDEFSVDAPGADLLMPKAYEVLIEDVVDAKHIGQGVIDGIECEHLAFRNLETDWQIWIEIGSRPVPRQYVITSKAVTGGPQYTLRVKDWQTGTAIAADAFSFQPPTIAKKVEFKDLVNIDEVPAGIVVGAKQ